MKTQYLCFPLNTKATTTTNSSPSTSSSTTNGQVPPPSSLLNRFRDAVFRLIMATALSKTINSSNNNNNPSSSSSKSSSNNHHDYYRNSSNLGQESVRRSCYLYDPYHSEALADCIEFIKKSATSSPSDHHCRLHDDLDIGYDDDDHEMITRDSTVSSDVVVPLPVM